MMSARRDMMSRMRVGFLRFAPAVLLSVVFAHSEIAAQSRRPGIPKRNLSPSSSSTTAAIQQETFDFGIGTQMNGLIRDSFNTDLYDPITIAKLRQMKDEAAPQVNLDDYDPELTREVTERATAIQSGRTMIKVIEGSELRETYLHVKRSFAEFQRLFRYSIQQEGDRVTVSRNRIGRRWIELNVEFNPRRVLEPQLRIGDVVRFRYDYQDRAPLLEYQVSF